MKSNVDFWGCMIIAQVWLVGQGDTTGGAVMAAVWFVLALVLGISAEYSKGRQ
jgi:hypothetical protein